MIRIHIPFFDSTTGKPQVWYWRGVNGEYEFYDNQGFHKEGDELKIIDKDVIDQWKQYVIAKKKEQQKRDQELRDNQERERLRQIQLQKDQEIDQQQQAERRQRDEQAQDDRQQRQAQSGAMCDQAAANPNDRQKRCWC